MSLSDFIPSLPTLKEQALSFAGNRARQWANNDRSYLGKTLRAVVLTFEGWYAAVRQFAQDAVPGVGTSHEGLAQWLDTLGLTTGTPGQYGFRAPIAAKGGIGTTSGTGGSTATAGQELVGPDGVTRFKLRTTITLPVVVGTAQIAGVFDAITAGSAGNLDTGAVLTWDPAPPGFDPQVVLTSGFGDTGKDGETDGEAGVRIAKRLQTPPKGGAPQDYGHGGSAWPENAVDSNGVAIEGVRVYGYSRNGGYDGVGGPMGVVALIGSGIARQSSVTLCNEITLYVKGTTGREGQAPIAHSVRYIPPYMPASRGLICRLRGKPSKDIFKYDWTLGALTPPVVAAWTAGPPAVITLAALAPSALKQAIDRGLRPRIQIDTRDGLATNAPTGPIIPVQVRVVSWVDVAGQTQLTLEDPLPAGFQVPSAMGTEDVLPGGPVVQRVAQSMIDALNELGPKRGDFADENDLWKDTASITNLSTAAENAVAEDGITPLLAQVGVGTVTIQAGGTAPALAVDVDPVDNTINGPELLYAARILVWDA